MTFNRNNFITLNGSRLFTAKEVADLIRECEGDAKKERNRILKELEQIAQHNWEEIETDEGEMIRMCFCGELIGKIEELRGEL